MYIFSLLEHSIWTYISFLFSSLSLSRNLSKNSNFVRTRDTFIPIANDKCVVMLRAWQITPCSLFLLILKIVPTFFPLPPPDESLDRVTRTKINKSCSLLEVSFVFSKKGKKKSFALVRETRFDYHELSCYTTRRRRQFRCNHMKQIEWCECFESGRRD